MGYSPLHLKMVLAMLLGFMSLVSSLPTSGIGSLDSTVTSVPAAPSGAWPIPAPCRPGFVRVFSEDVLTNPCAISACEPQDLRTCNITTCPQGEDVYNVGYGCQCHAANINVNMECIFSAQSSLSRLDSTYVPSTFTSEPLPLTSWSSFFFTGRDEQYGHHHTVSHQSKSMQQSHMSHSMMSVHSGPLSHPHPTRTGQHSGSMSMSHPYPAHTGQHSGSRPISHHPQSHSVMSMSTKMPIHNSVIAKDNDYPEICPFTRLEGELCAPFHPTTSMVKRLPPPEISSMPTTVSNMTHSSHPEAPTIVLPLPNPTSKSSLSWSHSPMSKLANSTLGLPTSFPVLPTSISTTHFGGPGPVVPTHPAKTTTTQGVPQTSEIRHSPTSHITESASTTGMSGVVGSSPISPATLSYTYSWSSLSSLRTVPSVTHTAVPSMTFPMTSGRSMKSSSRATHTPLTLTPGLQPPPLTEYSFVTTLATLTTLGHTWSGTLISAGSPTSTRYFNSTAFHTIHPSPSAHPNMTAIHSFHPLPSTHPNSTAVYSLHPSPSTRLHSTPVLTAHVPGYTPALEWTTITFFTDSHTHTESLWLFVSPSASSHTKTVGSTKAAGTAAGPLE